MMYQTFKLLLACYLALGFFNPNPNNKKQLDTTNTYSLTVELEGILVKKGTLYVAMYATEDSFFKEPFQRRKFSSTEFPEKFTYDNLPEGEYAITIYQDLNNNSKLDKFFSIPVEPYGISNNVRTFPSFYNSKIELKQNKSIKIKIKN